MSRLPEIDPISGLARDARTLVHPGPSVIRPSRIPVEFLEAELALEEAEAKAEHMQARASAIDELMGAGVLPGASGSPRDALEREFAGADDLHAVDADLEALKREIGTGNH